MNNNYEESNWFKDNVVNAHINDIITSSDILCCGILMQ